MNLFAAEMLNRNLVELHTLNVFGDFFLDLFGGGVVLERELTDLVLDKCGVSFARRQRPKTTVLCT